MHNNGTVYHKCGQVTINMTEFNITDDVGDERYKDNNVTVSVVFTVARALFP